MGKTTDSLISRLPYLTLDELSRMVTTDRAQYDAAAVSAIEGELVRRGVSGVAAEGQPKLKLAQPRRRRWSYEIDDEASALQVARQGAIAAWVIAGMTTVFALLANRVDSIGALGMNLWSLLDAAIFLAIGIGIWRGSLTCAVLGLVMHLVERLYWWVTIDKFPGGIAVLLLFAFVNAVRGTRELRRYRIAKAAHTDLREGADHDVQPHA